MPFRFKAHETISDGAKRILCEQIERAIDDISSRGPRQANGVHAARKRIKKVRGLLRLIRLNLGEHRYSIENRRWRDLARSLAGARDTDAMIETVEKLQDRAEGVGTRAVRGVRHRLLRRRSEPVAATELGRAVRSVVAQLNDAHRRVRKWKLNARGFKGMARGVKSTYSRGRKSLLEACKKPSADHLHEWRKEAKYYWYHVRLLRSSWPVIMNSYRSELRDLSELLGDEHDLAVLRELIRKDADLVGDTADKRILFHLIERRRQELRSKAEILGRKNLRRKAASSLDPPRHVLESMARRSFLIQRDGFCPSIPH